jgi:hypothetical protein
MKWLRPSKNAQHASLPLALSKPTARVAGQSVNEAVVIC